MHFLDQPEQIRKIDTQDMAGLIARCPDQIKEAIRMAANLSFPRAFGEGISHVVFSGLGGSAIGADFARSYLSDQSPVPLWVNREYGLPGFVSEKTLLVVSSYSGDTEETLSALQEGLKRRARILAIASGGELARLAKRHSFPLISIPAGFPPRAALGYSAMLLLAALSRLGFPDAYRPDEADEAQALLHSLAETRYGLSVPFEKNPAKQAAHECFGRFVVIYSAASRLDTIALRLRSQIAENAKALASHHLLPEMNHNELVGWRNPAGLLRQFCVLLLKDAGDHDRVRLRMNLTRDIISKEAHRVIELASSGKGLLARMFSLIHLGDWISFYLAILYQVDPTPVPVIQQLKSELAKEPIAT